MYIVIEMAFTGREKAFCVLEYARTQSNMTEFSKKSPTAMQIWPWHKKFKEEGCLCRAKGSGRPLTSEETVERVRQIKTPAKPQEEQARKPRFLQRVWHVLRIRLLMKPNKLQLVQMTSESANMGLCEGPGLCPPSTYKLRGSQTENH
eukprot:XP_014780505.1 PREDICTED: uncharacterized protein LOC106876455 [Octopus bimaculoides]